MGEMADQLINQMIDSMFDYEDEDPEIFGFRSRGVIRKRLNHINEKGIWRDRDGNPIRIKDMSTVHIMNAMNFADNYKIRELEDELEERKHPQAPTNTPPWNAHRR